MLKEVEALLREGRAVGAKQLTEYLEVRGYADAAQWVYRQGLAPGDWTTEELSLGGWPRTPKRPSRRAWPASRRWCMAGGLVPRARRHIDIDAMADAARVCLVAALYLIGAA